MSQEPREQTRFQPVEIQKIDGRLSKLASEKNIPTLVPTSASKVVAARDARSPSKPLTIDVPDYLRTALKVDAARTGVSVRYLVLMALAQDGYDIDVADLIEDGRRLR